VRLLGLAAFLLAIPLTALSQGDQQGIDVVDVSGPLDASAIEFVVESIEQASEEGQELILLQIDSRAVLDSATYERLVDVVETPPLPVAVWVGPAPAQAFGGAALLLETASHAAIAPGSSIGLTSPLVLGEEVTPDLLSDLPFESEVVEAEDTGFELQPTLRQYLQDLDGRTFETATGEAVVSTVREFGEGVTLKDVTFSKPGLLTRFFRLAVIPEAAFFFLVVGLSVVTFEFFALGPGVAAGVAALSLLPAGWGLVNLPTRWWGLLVVILGWGLLTAAYQKGGFVVMTAVGTILLQVGGMALVDGGGQIDPRWWLVFPSVLAVLFFFLIAMPTVQRARLSTQTIGRGSLVGREGSALVDFDPEGLVEVDGARWRATAHREAALVMGSRIIVTGVDGLYLEVEPLDADREN
jgi:membrane-bound serine protease (ClpP class)